MRKLLLAAGALVGALTVSLPGAFARVDGGAAPAADPGITSRSITIGGTFPFSGPVSGYAPIARGMETYFRFVNARKGPDGKRGVYGRQIIFKTYDDGYNPARTVQLTNQLILQDKVFAIYGTLGTEPNLAIRPILTQRRIPQLNIATGASYWGTQYRQFPWTMGWQTDYVAEGRVYARWILQNRPRARIAIFYQNDDYGKDYLRGIKSGLGRRTNMIVSELGYEVTDSSYASQIARQKASGADTWILLTTAGTPTVRALGTGRALAWRPDQIVINSVAATDQVMAAAARQTGADYVNGAVSTGYLKNNTNPKYRNDPAIRSFRRIMSKWGPEGGVDIRNSFYFYGIANAYDFVKLLYAAGKNPTRRSLMAAAQRRNWVNPYTLPGVRTRTTRTDHFPLDQGKVLRYTNGSWTEISPLYKGR
ncbi:MAG TPA: ABC transporter substrate-binding protein [Gaiellaceae bacterium]|nr:ABC transporter substrate-binding protein [Gaiellaceae bacterium]